MEKFGVGVLQRGNGASLGLVLVGSARDGGSFDSNTRSIYRSRTQSEIALGGKENSDAKP